MFPVPSREPPGLQLQFFKEVNCLLLLVIVCACQLDSPIQVVGMTYVPNRDSDKFIAGVFEMAVHRLSPLEGVMLNMIS